MKRLLLITLICIGMYGCATTPARSITDVALNNRSNLIKLRIGLSRQEAMDIMGIWSIKAKNWFWIVPIDNPYKSEILEGQNNKRMEVLYYYTNSEDTFFDVEEDALTPLVFQNDRLIGWGDSFLRENAIRYGVIR